MAEDVEKRRERMRRWHAENRDRVREQQRAWRQAHPESVRDHNRRYYATHREQAAAYRTTETRREVHRAGQGARRAVAAGVIATLTLEEWQAILEEFDNCCAYCQARGVPLAQEHMTPVIRGGHHTKHNVVPACTPCNKRKFTSTLFEFAAKGLPDARRRGV